MESVSEERSFTVGPGTGDIAVARAWVSEQIAAHPWPGRWRPDAVSVVLVVSELVTNALRYTGGRVRVHLGFATRRLRVAVSDDSGGLPVPRRGDLNGGGGFGLHLVAVSARAWGVVPTAHGKRVWADFTDAAGARSS